MEDFKEGLRKFSEELKAGKVKEFYVAISGLPLGDELHLQALLRDLVNSCTGQNSYSFENTTTEIQLSDDIPTDSREEVYKCIESCVKPAARNQVKEKFEKRYSPAVWGEQIPLTGIKQIFLAEHIEDLI